jgi:hypothetical protein
MRLAELAHDVGRAEALGALARQHDVAGDAGEDVVEVVGDAAGELADRLHLLRLAQLALELGLLELGLAGAR